MSPLPLLDRRGGCAIKKILRSNYCRHRRGGCSNSNKTFEQPPRPLLVDASRRLLMSRPPLLSRRGNGAHPNSCTPSMTAPPGAGYALKLRSLSYTHQINFTHGIPANQSLPLAEIAEAAKAVLEKSGAAIMQ